MKTRALGSTGIVVSELCLSTSTFARFANQEETFAMLDTFRDAGGNFVQTSGICPGADLGDGCLGLPEEFLGRWLDARAMPRSQMVIATRMGFARPLVGGGTAYGELVRACIRDSLRRIGIGHLDFLVVEWSEAMLPLDESIASVAAMIHEGFARHAILAHFPAAHLAAAAELMRRALAGIEIDYSLIYRSRFEQGASNFCRAQELGFIARSPLAGGYLVASPAPDIGSFRWRTAGDPLVANAAHAVWPTLDRMARAHRAAPAQIALAWVLGQPAVSSILISTRTLAHLRELIAATDLVLSSDEHAALEPDSSFRRGPPTTAASAPPA